MSLAPDPNPDLLSQRLSHMGNCCLFPRWGASSVKEWKCHHYNPRTYIPWLPQDRSLLNAGWMNQWINDHGGSSKSNILSPAISTLSWQWLQYSILMLSPGSFQLISYLWVLFINQRQVGNGRHILAKITGVELLFTWPSGFPKSSIFHHSDSTPWSCFYHLLVSSTMTTLTWQAFGIGWRLVSIFLPYLVVYFFLILLVQIVPMRICLLDIPIQSLWVSFLP